MGERPKLCANCGKLMGVGDECPYCGADNRRVGVRLKRVAGAGGGGIGVTATLIGVNLFLFFTAIAVGGVHEGGGLSFMRPDMEVLFRLGLQDNRAIAAGQWWRLFTMVFLHLGLLHVAFNCYILWYVGRMLESEFGGRLMFFVYMTAGLAGSVGSYLAGIGGAGASGAVFGTLGAVLVHRRMVDGHFRHPVSHQLLVLLGINVVFGLVMSSHVNNVAHFGGLAAGAAVAFVVTRHRIGRTGAVVVMLASWVMGAVTAVSFGMMMWGLLFHGSGEDVQAATRCWRQAHAAVAQEFQPDEARQALACLEDAPSLEAPADEARERALRSLRLAIGAWETGDDGGLQRGTRQTGEALTDFLHWRDEALPRYGLTLVRDR
ncbi:MAG: rhomboid family intramembrane serine protease [Myxococcota bacterium]